MEGGVLPLDEETVSLLKTKHPESQPCSDEAIVDFSAPPVHPVVFESINADSVKIASINTRGGAGPSGVDADGWRHILVSRNFGMVSEDLRNDLAQTI